MLHLYLDTNIYLTFYHFTNDELEELRKLLVMIEKTKEIKLHLPNQTYDEFYRNRDLKIKDALKRFDEYKLPNEFPRFCKEYPEFEQLLKAIKQFEENKATMRAKLMKDIMAFTLAADTLVEDLFRVATLYNTSDLLLAKAKMRSDLGQPPGKPGSYGDAVNWETLLEAVEDSNDLHLVSADADYYSPIDPTMLKSYLAIEWNRNKGASLMPYKTLSNFFSANYPHIKIASEHQKNILIKNLFASDSFPRTIAILEELSRFSEFTTDQLSVFISACIKNKYVFWIKLEPGIKDFIFNIVDPNRDIIDKVQLAIFDSLYLDPELPIEVIAGALY